VRSQDHSTRTDERDEVLVTGLLLADREQILVRAKDPPELLAIRIEAPLDLLRDCELGDEQAESGSR